MVEWKTPEHSYMFSPNQIIYMIKIWKICITQAFLSIFGENRVKIYKIYTKISQITHTLPDAGLRDRALFHLCTNYLSSQQI